MPESSMTVRRLFFGHLAPESGVGRRLGRGGQLNRLHEQVGQQLGNVQWRVVAKEIGKQIVSVLDFGVAEKILAPAWQRWQLLQEYREAPPGESALVHLCEHTVSSVQRPHIDILVKDVEVGRLELQVELAVDLEGVVLQVRDSRIWGIEGGAATGRGRLACTFADKTVYELERKSRRFAVGAGVRFKDGLEIPQLDLAGPV